MRSQILAATIVLLVGGGCVYDAFTVTQAGTTPAPRAMLYDGQPLDRAGRAEIRSTTVVTPVGDGDKESGNFVARQHSDLSLRGARGNSDFGMQLGAAWTKGSEAASPNLGPKPDASAAITVKVAGHHSFQLNDQFRLGVGFATGMVSVPIVISANPGNTERDEALDFELALVPSYRVGPLAVFGGFNITSEAYVPRAILVDDSYDVPEATTDGAVVLSAGASYTLPNGLYLMGQLAKPVSDLAEHGLQLDVSIGFNFGTKPAPRPAMPPPPPYYYPPPPAPVPAGPAPAGPGGTPPS